MNKKIFFSSYYPLCSTPSGRKAIKEYKLFPYIDGACRREPDFEREFPSITGLCRPGFSEKLEKTNLIVYTTNGLATKKIVAILEVIDTRNSHPEAADWYRERSQTIPNNIMVNETTPFNFDYTHQKLSWGVWTDAKTVEAWDSAYKERAEEFSNVAICQIWRGVKELHNPPEISSEDMFKIFGRIPGTQNPALFKEEEWNKFKKFLFKSEF